MQIQLRLRVTVNRVRVNIRVRGWGLQNKGLRGYGVRVRIRVRVRVTVTVMVTRGYNWSRGVHGVLGRTDVWKNKQTFNLRQNTGVVRKTTDDPYMANVTGINVTNACKTWLSISPIKEPTMDGIYH